jgi:exonuclease SbcD
MRVLHSGDWHISNTGVVAGRYVLRDGVNLCLWDKIQSIRAICDYVAENEIDLIAIPGDLFDKPNPENVAIKVAVEAIEKLSEFAPVVITKGNHDGGKGGEWATALSVFGSGLRKHGIYVSDRPEIIPILSNQRKIQVFTLPYPRKSALYTVPQYKTLSPEELSRFVGFKMEEILNGFTAQFDRYALNVLVGHFTVASGMYSPDQTVPPFDISIRKECFEKFDLVLLGHLHMPQEFYSGAIFRGGFGEEDTKAGFKVHELSQNADGAWIKTEERFIELPARKYLTLRVDEFLENGTEKIDEAGPETAIRIKGRVKRYEYDEVVQKIKALHYPFIKNAIEVESETVRVEEGGISQEPTVEEAVRIWGQGKDGVDKFIERLVEAARDIEYQWKVGRGEIDEVSQN